MRNERINGNNSMAGVEEKSTELVNNSNYHQILNN